MKILMFLGQSQYDVLRSCARETASALRGLGHEVITYDLMVLGAEGYQQLYRAWKPDLTVGFNPVYVPLDSRGTPHHAVTGTPHIVCLAPHPPPPPHLLRCRRTPPASSPSPLVPLRNNSLYHRSVKYD